MGKIHLDTDVVIIGGGLSGMRAAAQLLYRDVEGVILSAGPIGLESAALTPLAVNYMATEWLDVPASGGDREKLVADILAAGLGHAHEPSVKVLARNVDAEFEHLLSLGLKIQTSMGVHVRHLGCFASRKRDVALEQLREVRPALWRQIKVRQIEHLDHVFATKIFVDNGRFVGVAGVNRNGDTVTVRAKAGVLAAGGGAAVYSRSVVPSMLVGSSAVLGHEAGAAVKNLHFVEFVIGVIDALPRVQKFKFLGTIKLRDSQNRDILEGLYPSRQELEKAVELRSQHYSFTMHDQTGLIDLAIARAADRGGCAMVSHTGSAPITLYSRCTNGGVVTDENAATAIQGLFACGEGATGAHGALRVGGTYLDEGLVFGRIAGKAAVDFAKKQEKLPDASINVEERVDPAGGLQQGELENFQKMVRDVMTAKMSVTREPEEMKAAQQVAQTALKVVSSKGCREPSLLWLWHETRTLAAFANLVIEHALAAPETCGPHHVSSR
jgi:L-aspartate oxidase